MMNKLKILLATGLMSLGLSLGLGVASAAAITQVTASTSKSAACGGLSALDSTEDCTSDGSKTVVSHLASTVVNVLSLVVGIAAIIMIIVSGLRYVTSGGDSNSVSNAKNSLIYAIVGLVVASLAQFLVHYVLNKVG